MRDIDGLRGIAVAVVQRAILDMQTNGVGGSKNVANERYRDYLQAVVWLGSRQANVYLDVVGVEQTEVLYAISWGDYATNVLADPKAQDKLTISEREVLYISLDKLGKRFGKHV